LPPPSHSSPPTGRGILRDFVKSGQVETERVFILEPKSLAPDKKEKVKESRVDFKLK
jgi:hypothetical protein